MDVRRITLTPHTILGVRETGVHPEDMSAFFARAMERAYHALQARGVHPVGPPLAVYRGDPVQGFDVTAGFPVEGTVSAITVEPHDGLEIMELPSGPAVAVMHVGSYDSMVDTYAGIEAWMSERHVIPREPMWEEYLTDPSENPDPATWRTRIVFPVVG